VVTNGASPLAVQIEAKRRTPADDVIRILNVRRRWIVARISPFTV